MMKRFSGLVLLAVLGTAWAANSAASRIRIRDEVSVGGERFTLADLLPPDTAEPLLTGARSIPLGYAPLPGATRVLYRLSVERRMQQHPKLISEIEVPERVLVRRKARLLTGDEIYRAIRDSLEKNGKCTSGVCANLSAEALRWPAIHVTQEDSGLRVTSMEFDARRRRTRFRLWASLEPASHPFDVFAQPMGGSHLPPGKAQGRVRNDALVFPGRAATLVFEGPGVRATTSVVALERGGMGQRIRVRRVENRAVIVGEVIGAQRLRARL